MTIDYSLDTVIPITLNGRKKNEHRKKLPLDRWHRTKYAFAWPYQVSLVIVYEKGFCLRLNQNNVFEFEI